MLTQVSRYFSLFFFKWFKDRQQAGICVYLLSSQVRPHGLQLTHQDALVHVAVVHIQADPDDAAVAHLLVVERQ